MGTKVVTREYPSLPGSDVRKKTKFVAIDKGGKPVMEDVSLVDCPDCGAELQVSQHAATADGLPHVTCGADCPGGGELVVVDYD